jgi:undecaprenyl-diphosphatase
MTSNVPPKSFINDRMLAMALFSVRPTQLDRDVASAIARDTNGSLEGAAQALTWGADEHVILAAAALAWIFTRESAEPARRMSSHILACSITTAVLPHVLKRLIDQERPDRETIRGHWRGIPFSGKASDAFPSGHALHVGALASAATLLPRAIRNLVWSGGAVLVTTRVVLLAHWTTDVLAGLAIGATLERALRKITRPLPLDKSTSVELQPREQ